MHLFTADGFVGEMITCNEGDLEWVPFEEISTLPLWSGDHIFLDLLRRGAPFFSLKVEYEGNRLARAVLNGEELSV